MIKVREGSAAPVVFYLSEADGSGADLAGRRVEVILVDKDENAEETQKYSNADAQSRVSIGARNQRQVLYYTREGDQSPSGTFTLMYGPVPIGSLNLTATAEQIRTALEASPYIGEKTITVFSDNFTSLSSNWVKLIGSGTASVVSDANASDGYALEANGYVWYEHNQNIAVDPNALYRIRVKVRQVQDPTSGGKQIYAGVSGVASDGTTRINTVGVDSWSGQHYFAASSDTLAVGSTYTEFVGYFWGFGTPAGGKRPNRTSPGLLYPNIAYIRPLFILNYNGGNGIARIDYVIIEKVGAVRVTGGPLGEKEVSVEFLSILFNADHPMLGASNPDVVITGQTAVTFIPKPDTFRAKLSPYKAYVRKIEPTGEVYTYPEEESGEFFFEIQVEPSFVFPWHGG